MSVVYFAQAGRSTKDADPSTGWPHVYARIGQPFDRLPIKIGFSADLHARLTAISCKAKARVWLVGAVAGGRVEEQRMHRMFEHLRLVPPFPEAGIEWFEPAWELTNFIISLPRPSLTDIDFTRRSIRRPRLGRPRLTFTPTMLAQQGPGG